MDCGWARHRVPEGNERTQVLIWSIGIVVYLIVFFWLGLATLRNGHGWLFFFGIFFPILWIFGAFARPRSDATPSQPA